MKAIASTTATLRTRRALISSAKSPITTTSQSGSTLPTSSSSHRKRGHGHGCCGLDLLYSAAKENGVGVLWDSIALDNPAVGLFLAHGFVEDRRINEAIYLRKDLVPVCALAASAG